MRDQKYKTFNGFSEQTLEFLQTNKQQNSKSWFVENKHLYEKVLLEPLKSLVSELSDLMTSIDPLFETKPAINKTISKIYRDTRFSKDKSLFKQVMWIVFKRADKEWKDAPCYFFEISPTGYRHGMGYYSASRSTMDSLRAVIDENPVEFLKAISFLKNQNIYQLEGDKYKRIIPNDYSPEIQDWYQRKNLYLMCSREIDDILLSAKLVEEMSFAFKVVQPLYQYLRKLHDQK
jgi:uncharacterized protein (TIGR02453 family)